MKNKEGILFNFSGEIQWGVYNSPPQSSGLGTELDIGMSSPVLVIGQRRAEQYISAAGSMRKMGGKGDQPVSDRAAPLRSVSSITASCWAPEAEAAASNCTQH